MTGGLEKLGDDTTGGTDAGLLRTSLYEEHAAAGAKLVPFAGWEMPVQYPTGITAEHHAVRRAAGLFDVSHMGEFEVRGERAAEFIQFVATNDVTKLEIGQAQYSALLKHDGGMLDDLLVYRFPSHWMLVVNASNRERDLAWIQHFAAEYEVEIRDRSSEIALLALQGPNAQAILSRIAAHEDLDAIGYYRFREGELLGRPAVISRTGYTGEDGFELYVDWNDASALWRELLAKGRDDGLIPAGLGARDSLRLEMGYALYGNDLDEDHTPLEAGLGWIVKLAKGPFVGRDALVEQKEMGIPRKLIGFRLKERGFPRAGYTVQREGVEIGHVTSGVSSPSLGLGIGMAYVAADSAAPETEIEIVIRDRGVPAEIVRPPFYREGTVQS